jgi:hypothetical protein
LKLERLGVESPKFENRTSIVVAEVVPPAPVILEQARRPEGVRIQCNVVKALFRTLLSPDDILNGLISKGYRIRARKAKGVRNIKTNFFKVFTFSGGIPDPYLNHCYLCKDVPVVDTSHKKVIHSHGFRQFGLIQLLTQVVNLDTVSLVINFGDGSPSCRILNPLKLFYFCPIVSCGFITSDMIAYNEHFAAHRVTFKLFNFGEAFEIIKMSMMDRPGMSLSAQSLLRARNVYICNGAVDRCRCLDLESDPRRFKWHKRQGHCLGGDPKWGSAF